MTGRAAELMALVIAAGLLLVACGGDAAEPDRTEASKPGTWTRVEVRQGIPVRIGDEIVTVAGGGVNDDVMEGFAFDLGSERSRALPRMPLSWRSDYSVLATGEEVIVWGGPGEPEGAAYDPASDSWRVMAASPLGSRFGHTAVWTGEEMLVWGGETGVECGGPTPRAGAAYSPGDDSWRPLPDPPIDGRYGHTAVWTGEAMLIWGGTTRDGLCDPVDPKVDGAAFDPTRNQWTRIAAAPIEWLERSHAFWTGEEMLVWNGSAGARYQPQTSSWSSISAAPLSERIHATAVWTGTEMLIWGGIKDIQHSQRRADGAAYDPETDRWSLLPLAPDGIDPVGDSIWTDDSMFVIGRRDSARFTPSAAAP